MARTILLADDSVTIQKVVELTFLDEDFRVVSYGNGTDAIVALPELRPDVVLADVHMPGADGYEVCAAVTAARPGTPVLLLVGTFEVFDAQRAAEVGASGHLKKPFDSQELLRQVRDLANSTAAAVAAADEVEDEAAAAESPAVPAEQDEGASWSFAPEESAQVADGHGEVAADTWGGVDPEAVGDLAAEAEPQWVAEPELGEPTPAPPSGETAEPATEMAPSAPAAELSDADVERIARRVAELIGDRAVKEIAWEVVPDLAELLLKSRIRELEASVE